jgi:putative transposase
LAAQIERFERFRDIYNNERPHEALGQVAPARCYQPSPRRFDGVLRSPEYASKVSVPRVRPCGAIKWQGNEIFISQALRGEPVGLFAIADGVWLVKYRPIVLGTMNGTEGFIRVAPATQKRPASKRNKPPNL